MTTGASLLGGRLELACAPTPVQELRRLGEYLHMKPGALVVKREDLNGFGGGGNKVRKLEYLCRDAQSNGCDTLVTGGAIQSNHVRMTAAAAAHLGMGCEVVFGGQPGDVMTGNTLLTHIFGAAYRCFGDDFDHHTVEGQIATRCKELAEQGKKPYLIPVGGSSLIGILGDINFGNELLQQDSSFDLVVVANGSGGTHAGLAAVLGDHTRVLGVDTGSRSDLHEAIHAQAEEAAQFVGLPPPVGNPQVDSTQVGPGYACPTDTCLEAIELAARLEGLLLDPVYTGKALAALIAARRSGQIGNATRVVFLHTGGAPALFAARYGLWLSARTPALEPA